MDFTGKQERNGATGGTATQVSAQPGPDATSVIASAVASTMSKAAYQLPTAVAGVVDFGTGMSGHDQAGEA